MYDDDPFEDLINPGVERLKAMREDLREDALQRQDHVALHLFAENDVLIDELGLTYVADMQVQDILKDCLQGDDSFEEHSYITCSDEIPSINSERGCPRCIILAFVERH